MISCSSTISDETAKKITDEYFKVAPVDDPTKFNQLSDQILEKITQKYNVSVSDYHKWLEDHPEYFKKILDDLSAKGKEKVKDEMNNVMKSGKDEAVKQTEEYLKSMENDISDLQGAAEEAIDEEEKKIDEMSKSK